MNLKAGDVVVCVEPGELWSPILGRTLRRRVSLKKGISYVVTDVSYLDGAQFVSVKQDTEHETHECDHWVERFVKIEI